MKRYFCILTLLILSTLLPINVYSQKKLSDYPQVSFEEKEYGDTLVLSPMEIQGIDVRVPKRTYDVFTCGSNLSDREIITISNKTYMIDSLLYNNYSEYAGSYDFETIYVLEKHKKKYYVIDFFNAFQLGTMVQPCYMILKVDGEQIIPHSIYLQTDIEDNSGRIESTVRVYFEKDSLYLKGVNLKLIKMFI